MKNLSDFRNLGIFQSRVGTTSKAMKSGNPKPCSYGSLTNPKITEDKLFGTSVKTDLEMGQELLGRTLKLQSDNQEVEDISVLNEKAQLYGCTVEREKNLEQKVQVIKYELEKAEPTTSKKEKAEQNQAEVESKCNDKIPESKGLCQGYFLRLKEENGRMQELLGRTLKQSDNQEIQDISVLNEKAQLYSCTVEREKTLEQKVEASLDEMECHLSDAKQQYDVILKGKQREVIKYELEKAEPTTSKKEKAEQNQAEVESKCNDKIPESKGVREGYFLHLKEKNGTMVKRIQQDNEYKEATLWSYRKEELQRIHSDAENELMKAKENQRALLQVMRQVDQELNSKKMGCPYPYGRKGHGISTNSVRSLHMRAATDSDKKEKDPPNQNYPGNTATVILDRENREASLNSYKRAIRKARAWCRSTSKPVDLSSHFGPGAEVYTTPAEGTFHLTFLYQKRRLTLFIYGRNLYVMGWHSEKNGTFQIVKDFISDTTCKFVDTGENYHDLTSDGDVAKVRVGIEAFIESFEVLDKCDGTVTAELASKLAMFCVGTSEAIRFQDIFEETGASFLSCYPYISQDTSVWIRSYRFYSEQYLNYLDQMLSGNQPKKIANRPGRKVTSIQELRQRIRVPLRDSFDKGKFGHEKAKDPVWSPPYADGKHWDDKQLDEDEDKYWPSHVEIEQEDDCESEDDRVETEQEDGYESEDDRVQKVDMSSIKDLNRSSAFRFSAIGSSKVDFLGPHGFFGAINSARMNAMSHCHPYTTALGQMKFSEFKSRFTWWPKDFSALRKFQLFTKFLNKFK